MKRLRYAILATTVVVGSGAISQAHEGHDHAGHDHGSEPRSHAPQDTGSPPAPPSDTFVPESRSLESGPPSREPMPNFSWPAEQRPSRGDSGFEPRPSYDVPADNFPESRPLRPEDRTPYKSPVPRRAPADEFQGFEPAPRDFERRSPCPLGQDFHGRCPSARDGWVCPRQEVFSPSQPYTLERNSNYECSWERDRRLGLSFDEFPPPPLASFPEANPVGCPTGACGHSHHESENWIDNRFDRRPNVPSDPSAPFFGNEPSGSPPPTFQPQSSEQSRFFER